MTPLPLDAMVISKGASWRALWGMCAAKALWERDCHIAAAFSSSASNLVGESSVRGRDS